MPAGTFMAAPMIAYVSSFVVIGFSDIKTQISQILAENNNSNCKNELLMMYEQ